MNQGISQEIRKLEEQKRSVLEFLKEQSEENLTKSEEGKWSMIQAMRHIQMAEEGSLNYMMKKSLAGDDLKKRPLKARIFLRLLKTIYLMGVRFKAPKVIANPPVTSLQKLEDDWSASRRKMITFVEEYPSKWVNKGVYRHPFVGLLNLEDGLKFFNIHLAHHRKQLVRIHEQVTK